MAPGSSRKGVSCSVRISSVQAPISRATSSCTAGTDIRKLGPAALRREREHAQRSYTLNTAGESSIIWLDNF